MSTFLSVLSRGRDIYIRNRVLNTRDGFTVEFERELQLKDIQFIHKEIVALKRTVQHLFSTCD